MWLIWSLAGGVFILTGNFFEAGMCYLGTAVDLIVREG